MDDSNCGAVGVEGGDLPATHETLSASQLATRDLAEWDRTFRVACGHAVARHGLRQEFGALVCGLCDAPLFRRRRVGVVR